MALENTGPWFQDILNYISEQKVPEFASKADQIALQRMAT